MKAIYAGSFDPWTNGHKAILVEASNFFEEVHIVIANNTSKKRSYNAEKIKDAIEKDLIASNITNCKVIIYEGLIALYCKENNIEYSVRGLRNAMDYVYEENISEINSYINPNLKTMYLRGNTKVVSSSMVKELLKFNEDVSGLVPPSVYEVIRKE